MFYYKVTIKFIYANFNELSNKSNNKLNWLNPDRVGLINLSNCDPNFLT